MIDESKSMDEGQNLEDLQDEQSIFSFQNLFAMLVLNWQWFLLSLIICVCGALIYLRYVEPVYQVSARMLIKDENKKRNANQIVRQSERVHQFRLCRQSADDRSDHRENSDGVYHFQKLVLETCANICRHRA